MIVDAFPFFNEFNLLKARMNYLNGIVDLHVLCEANVTHSGIPKRMLFQELRSQLGELNNKIVYCPLYYRPEMNYDFTKVPKKADDFSTAQWKLENAQRNGLIDGLRGLPLDALVLISDVDEIPSREAIANVKNEYEAGKATGAVTLPVTLAQEFYLYDPLLKYTKIWSGTVATTAELALSKTPQWHRDQRERLRHLKEGGWHLSYFTTPEGIRTKINSFAHQELNTPKNTDLEYIQSCINERKDLYFRRGYANHLETVETSTIDPALLKYL